MIFSRLIEDVLIKLPNLRHLDVSSSMLKDEGLELLFSSFVMKHANLQELKLSYNKMKKVETAIALQEALKLCPNLHSLTMKKCGLTSEMFKEIVKGV